MSIKRLLTIRLAANSVSSDASAQPALPMDAQSEGDTQNASPPDPATNSDARGNPAFDAGPSDELTAARTENIEALKLETAAVLAHATLLESQLQTAQSARTADGPHAISTLLNRMLDQMQTDKIAIETAIAEAQKRLDTMGH